MKVVIPALDLECPAALALSKEGILFDTVIMHNDYSYGELLCILWQSRWEGFIVIEHDVVAWPGAIYDLIECPQEWCSHTYPGAPHNLTNALGCIKVTSSLILNFPELPQTYNWKHKTWNTLDGAVIPALLSTGTKCHIHEPPFAHVKR